MWNILKIFSFSFTNLLIFGTLFCFGLTISKFLKIMLINAATQNHTYSSNVEKKFEKKFNKFGTNKPHLAKYN